MSITKDNATAIRNDVVRQLRHALGLHEMDAVALADEISICVAKRLSGVHIPARLIKEARNTAIRRDFTGRNHAELASKYGVTRSMIYKILCNKG
jgi:Mor family transcriptional regulator